jgi:hypothetical protein
MPVSNLPGWIALASFALACGLLVRGRLRAEADDPRTEVLMEAMTALVASSTLGSLPRLFGLENEVVRWSITGVSAAFGVFAWIQIVRGIRQKNVPTRDELS